MSLNIWYKADVRRILAALASAGAPRGPEYIEALGDVAIAFGLTDGAGARGGLPRLPDAWSPLALTHSQ